MINNTLILLWNNKTKFYCYKINFLYRFCQKAVTLCTEWVIWVSTLLVYGLPHNRLSRVFTAFLSDDIPLVAPHRACIKCELIKLSWALSPLGLLLNSHCTSFLILISWSQNLNQCCSVSDTLIRIIREKANLVKKAISKSERTTIGPFTHTENHGYFLACPHRRRRCDPNRTGSSEANSLVKLRMRDSRSLT